MKRTRLTCGVLFWGICISAAADPETTYEQTPLPPGPIIKQAPAYSQWQISFSYASRTPDQGSASSASAASDPANAPGSHLPRLLTVTRTKPQWHTMLVDVSGVKKEAWFDGSMLFAVGQKDSSVVPINMSSPRGRDELMDYSPGHDFPDVDWVSRNNYLGTQDGKTWVFKYGPEGPTVWVDSTTHYPFRWQKGLETRTIQFLDPPTEQLKLPANVADVAADLRRLNELSRVAPPHL